MHIRIYRTSETSTCRKVLAEKKSKHRRSMDALAFRGFHARLLNGEAWKKFALVDLGQCYPQTKHASIDSR